DQVFTTAALPVTAPPADTTPPDVTVTKAPKKKITTKKAKAKVKVSFGSEAGATFTCRVDKGKATKCGSPFSATVKSKPGKGLKHTIQITATDSAGNVSAPKKVSFKVVRKR
nr:hypothetical protein [Candidatus Nanopelagicales bacterium]